MDNLRWKWMEWMGKMGGIWQGRGWKEEKGLGEDLEYVGRNGFTNIKGGKFLKSGKKMDDLGWKWMEWMG